MKKQSAKNDLKSLLWLYKEFWRLSKGQGQKKVRNEIKNSSEFLLEETGMSPVKSWQLRQDSAVQRLLVRILMFKKDTKFKDADWLKLKYNKNQW